MIVVICYIIAYEYSIRFAVDLNDCHTRECERMKGVHESCLLCTRARIGHLRGPEYYIGAMSPKKLQMLDHCLVTFWSAAHFFLYMIFGLLAPNLFWETFAIGVGFELYEWRKFGCQDLFDIAENTAGYGVGRLIGRAIGIERDKSSLYRF